MSDHQDYDFEEAQAYADGELSREARDVFEARLQSSPELQQFVNETFRMNGMVHALRRTEERERLATEDLETSPLSDHDILHRAQEAVARSKAQDGGQTDASATVVNFPKNAFWGRSLSAMAASFVVGAVTLGLGYSMGIGSSADLIKQALAETVQQEAAIRQASLEHNLSGTTSEWSDPRADLTFTVTPLRTFVNKDGVYCREYKQTVSIAGSKTEQISFACRRKDQGWIAEDIVKASDGI